MEDELEQCPFCTGKAELESTMILGINMWRVKCLHCFARTYYESSPEEAAHQWNWRPE